MGKLTETLYDTARHIGTASQAGWKNISFASMWKDTKQAVRDSFDFRNSIAALAVLMLTSVGVYTIQDRISTTEHVYRVYIDGKYQGVVRDKSLIEEQVTAYGSKMKATVSYAPVNQAVKVTSEYAVSHAIDLSTRTIMPMVAVRVNGRDVVYLKDEATAQQLVDQLKAKYATEGAGEVTLADTVDFVKFDGDKEKVTDLQSALALVEKGKEEQKKYVVSRGDSLWDIAAKNNMTVEDLHTANPQIADIDAIAEGEQINLNAVEPLINVQSVSEESRDLTVHYEIANRDDSSLYEGEEKVIQEGVKGTTKQTVRVTRKNGTVVQEEILKEEVVTAPTKEIVAKGTKKQTYGSYVGGNKAAAASGNWAYPIAGGYISSVYGENRSGKPHLAIDIAASTGTAVYSSNNGTVSFAGDAGDGYGNSIRINHGNGVMTIYGHLSSIGVSPGQAVSRGQRIGGVGSTGWSTGAHLHYEVRVNGVQVNPSSYM
jgi:murein DD-endopeptidase MepM/ murein hydrolase activator NlpD